MTDEIKEPSYFKPVIHRMVEAANGHTIYNDMRDPNSNRDPYAPSRDLVYSMKMMLKQLWDDLKKENDESDPEAVGKSGFTTYRLLEGFNSLVDTINSFVGKNRGRVDLTIDECAKNNGYADLEPELKLYLEACLGRLYLAAFFFAARSLTPQGGAPMGDIGYGKAFDFIANEVKQALDGVETPYARKLKDARKEKD